MEIGVIYIMIKTTDEKEMESVIRDILNPFRDDIDIEYEAWNLTHEEGWHKQIKAEWIPLDDNGNGWFQNGKQVFPKYCSNCKNVFAYASNYFYCPNCGAKMIGIREK